MSEKGQLIGAELTNQDNSKTQVFKNSVYLLDPFKKDHIKEQSEHDSPKNLPGGCIFLLTPFPLALSIPGSFSIIYCLSEVAPYSSTTTQGPSNLWSSLSKGFPLRFAPHLLPRLQVSYILTLVLFIFAKSCRFQEEVL